MNIVIIILQDSGNTEKGYVEPYTELIVVLICKGSCTRPFPNSMTSWLNCLKRIRQWTIPEGSRMASFVIRGKFRDLRDRHEHSVLS